MKKPAQAGGGTTKNRSQWVPLSIVLILCAAFGASFVQQMRADPSGRVILVFPVDATHVAMLRQRTWSRGGANKFGGASTIGRNSYSWTLVVVDPTTGKALASTELFETDFTGSAPTAGSHSMLRTGEYLFIDAPSGLLRLNLRTAAMDDLAALRARTPEVGAWKVGDFDEAGGFVLIHDLEMHWWRLHGDLRVEPTKQTEVVRERPKIDDEFVGCISGRKAHFVEKGGRSRFKLFEKPQKPGVRAPKEREPEPEGNLLDPEVVFDKARQCAVDTELGGLVLSRQTVRVDAPRLLSLARPDNGDLAWTHPLAELCNGLAAPPGSALPPQPDGARLFGGDVLIVKGDSLCMVGLGEGRTRWQANGASLGAADLGMTLIQLEADGPLLDAWFTGETGTWAHVRIDPATGNIERQNGKSTLEK